MEAEITLEYNDTRTAEAVARAVSPDNFKTPKGLTISTSHEKNQVATRMRFHGKFPTFVSTINDLLFCISTAEKTLQIIKKLE